MTFDDEQLAEVSLHEAVSAVYMPPTSLAAVV